MSKGIYVGVDGTARKVTKAYAGVENKARKITKGYVGVGGVARPFYSAEKKVAYYGTLDPIEDGYLTQYAASNGDYAVFAGDHGGVAYSKTLAKAELPKLSPWGTDSLGGKYYTFYGNGLSLGNQAIFPLGKWDSVDALVAYSVDLSYTTAQLDSVVEGVCAANVVGAALGEHAVFGAGAYEGTTSQAVLACDSNLVSQRLEDMDCGGIGCVAAANKDYILFGGGWYGNYITAYSKDLVKVDIAVAENRIIGDFAATGTTDEYALFAGGAIPYEENVIGPASEIYAYDTNLLCREIGDLDCPTDYNSASVLDGFWIIQGGTTGVRWSGDDVQTNRVEVINPNLVKLDTFNAGAAREDHSNATVANFAIFSGGYAPDDATEQQVDVFALI